MNGNPPLEDLLDRYAPLVRRVAARHALQHADQDDVYQSVCLLAIRKRHELPVGRGLKRWLASAASWHSRALRRRRRPASGPEPADFALDDSRPLPEEMAIEAEDLGNVLDAFAVLSTGERTLLESCFLAERPPTYAALAAQLGVAPGTIGSMRQRALEKLRQELHRRGF